MSIDQVLEGRDLSTLHTALTLIGAGLAIYVMQLTSHEHEDAPDPVWVQWVRRIVLGGIAMAFLWNLNYAHTKDWQPWPPELALMVATIGQLFVRAVAIHLRIKRDGSFRHRELSTVAKRNFHRH